LPDEIIYCNSDGNYTIIQTIDKKITISKTLKFVEALLPKSVFYRIHQSYIMMLSALRRSALCKASPFIEALL
jgi:two-component system LytT family response regulator